MMILLLHLVLVVQVVLTSAQTTTSPTHHYKRFCYVASWARYRDSQVAFNPEDVGANLCSHLSLAFATLDDTGTQLKAADPSDDPVFYKRFTAIKNGHPHVKILLSVGGWNMGSELFSLLVSNDSNINNFATNAVKFLRDRNFDGLDLDWEYPGDRGSPAGDKERFTKLVQTLHQVFQTDGHTTGKKALLLTAALGPTNDHVLHSYEPAKIARYLDLINLMTYDMHGPWDDPLVTGHHSALYGTTADPYLNIDYLANHWAQLGVPKRKLLIGLPFYARTVSLNDTSVTDVGSAAYGPGQEGSHTHESGLLAYYEDGATTHMSANQSVPYLVDNARWVGYDDEKSLQEKVKYVIDNDFGGVMVWALDMDDFSGICGKKYPLIHAIKDAFHSLVGK